MTTNRKYPNSLFQKHKESRVTLVGAAIVAGVVGLSGEASGAGSKEAMQGQASQARKACLSGDYQTGVALLSDLFVATKDPVMIFNQGRCFEQNRRYEDAVSRFEEYLRITKNTNAKDRPEAEEHIAECNAKLEKARTLTPPAPGPAPDLPPSPPRPADDPVVVKSVETAPAEPAPGGKGLRTAGIVVGAAGVVGLGAGLVFNLKANSVASELNRPTGYDRDKLSDRTTYKNLSWVGYGVGAAGLITGVVLYGLGASAANASNVALVPTVGPGFSSLSLQGVF